MKELCPKTHILALVTNEKDDQTIAAWNVDATLPIGVTPLELSAAIEALLPGNC
jgi:hypothetical protein